MAEAGPPAADPVRRWVFVLLGLAAVLFAYTVLADKLTPSTSQASVQAFLVRLAPEVSGRVTEVGVADNATVTEGETLFRLDPEPFRIAVEQAEARVAGVGQTIGASTAGVETAQARVAEATASRDNARDQAARVLELVRRGVYPQARGDDASAALAHAEAALLAAQSELERARRQLGPAGTDNPQLRDALAALARARLDLVHAEVTAPGPGVVTNVTLAPGGYVAAGQPALTYLDARAIWVVAMLRENSLEFVRQGTEAAVVFDGLPARIFRARVESVGWGIGGTTATDAATGLLTQPRLRTESRRFPVTLVLVGEPPRRLRYGSQATVLLHAGGGPVMDAIGTALLRAYSLLTYLS